MSECSAKINMLTSHCLSWLRKYSTQARWWRWFHFSRGVWKCGDEAWAGRCCGEKAAPPGGDSRATWDKASGWELLSVAAFLSLMMEAGPWRGQLLQTVYIWAVALGSKAVISTTKGISRGARLHFPPVLSWLWHNHRRLSSWKQTRQGTETMKIQPGSS